MIIKDNTLITDGYYILVMMIIMNPWYNVSIIAVIQFYPYFKFNFSFRNDNP